MIQNIKDLKCCLISLFVPILLLSCSEKRTLEWHLVGNVQDYSVIEFGIKNNKGNEHFEKVQINKTKEIPMKSNERFCYISHDSNYCVMLNYDLRFFDVLEIYIFPNRNVTELADSYIVELADSSVLYYFVEGYDRRCNCC